MPTDTKGTQGTAISEYESCFSNAANLITRGGLGRDPGFPSHLPSTDYPTSTAEDITKAVDLYASQFCTGQPRSLSGVALRSFLLGFMLSFCLIMTLFLSYLHLSI